MGNPTPGPWVASYIGDWWVVVTEANHDVGDDDEPRPIPVVDLHHGGYDWSDFNLGDIEGNARLIAAAPELLEALKSVENRTAYASNLFHDSTRWLSEDAPEGEGSLWEWVFAPVNSAIAKARGEVA